MGASACPCLCDLNTSVAITKKKKSSLALVWASPSPGVRVVVVRPSPVSPASSCPVLLELHLRFLAHLSKCCGTSFAEKIHHQHSNSEQRRVLGSSVLAGKQVWVGSCCFWPLQVVHSPQDFGGSAAVGAQLCFRVVTTSSSPLSCVVVTGQALKGPLRPFLLFLRRESEGAATSPSTP